MRQHLQYLSYWLLPIIVHSLYQLLAHGVRAYIIYDLAENTAFVVIILLVLSLIRGQAWRRMISKIAYVVFTMTLLFEGLYYDIFATYFSSSALFIFLETNTAEAFEFSESYLQPRMWINVAIALLLIVAFFKKSKPKLQSIFNQPVWMKSLVILLLAVFIKTSGYIIANVPYAIVKSSFEYYQEKQKMQAYEVDKPKGNFTQVASKKSTEKQVHVVVIGESTSRSHLGIYGYERPTTPNLSLLKDELLVYSDILSTSATTIQSLKKALTLNNFKDTRQESTLIQLMNQAGYETYWISNQKPVGIYDSFVTQVAKAADHYTFTNSTIYSSVTPLDEVLIPHYKKALQSEADKVFIVVHLLGTHAKYRYRYPDTFAYFKGDTPSPYTHDKATETVNHYDNSIRYVDYLLNEMINQLKEKSTSAFLLYFSDHGDEVYDVRDFKGHNDDNPTPAMFEIPFVVWQSQQYRNSSKITIDTARPATIDHLIYSISDLSDVQFDRYQSKKSIFSDDYQAPKQRVLGSQQDDYQHLIKRNSP